MAGIIGAGKVAILQTGRSPEALRPAFGDYNEMCAALFDAENCVETFAVLDHEFPRSLDGFDCVLVTGSRCGVYEPHSWIEPLEVLLRSARASGLKIIGICFGHQILAQAFGGVVEKSEKGLGAGVMSYELANRDAQSETISLCAWHQDQVISPPGDAEIVARSEFCEYAGLQYGDQMLSFQPHPEFSKDYVRALVELRSGSGLGIEAARRALDSLRRPTDTDVIQRFVSGWLAGG